MPFEVLCSLSGISQAPRASGQPVPQLTSNFSILQQHDAQLLRLGLLAERYFPDDPNTSLLKLRQLTELLAQLVATRVGIYLSREEQQYELIRRLQDHGILARDIAQLFTEVRKAGNAANHALSGDHRTALAALKITWQLGVWYHRTFKDSAYKSGAFIPPQAPPDKSAELQVELERLAAELATYREANQQTEAKLLSAEAVLEAVRKDQTFWEQLAAEAEDAKVALGKQLAELQLKASTQPKAAVAAMVNAANTAAAEVRLDEAETRKLIDGQLRMAGWDAESAVLRFGLGTRPKKGKNLAIAEWPTASGPADYVLFVGLTPIATVEAKRKNTDVSGALLQAKRYSRDFIASPETIAHSMTWGVQKFRVPFAYSTNGRSYLRQLSTKSGVWFCDLRLPENLAHALDGWHTPEGLTALLKRDERRANDQLKVEPFNYGFSLRPYQIAAIKAVEEGVANGQREMLLAMATGTGKTKTCIALIYRLLKTQRFRRVLFLVDRSALGEQAANAFKDTRMEGLQTFADTFGIKELGDQAPDTATSLHLATVQGMVQRLIFAGEGATPPAVDQYDCIVVDECHRGYLLDRELSDTELGFRGFEDYVSKYRRVLEYFDAFKIGLTATPALHTTQIFGRPIYAYSYREAVIDGFLVDHEPPVQIKTELSTSGIVWKVGEQVQIYKPGSDQLDLYTTPDEIKLEIEDFNRKVIVESFNRVVCEYLATEIDPTSPQKTLIFCATDAHADQVVDLLKQAFRERYLAVDDEAVIKITGAADKPLELIRKYKNEKMPSVVVTVDLLTTGVDVPAICNLVFLRRVNSRILFDQMLGRATRLCGGIGKDAFRIFDAVRIYEALQKFTEMRPVVINPAISFVQMAAEMGRVSSDEERALVRDQFVAKLQRTKRHLTEAATADFETRAGMTPEAFIGKLRSVAPSEIVGWFTQFAGLSELLDRKGDNPGKPIFVSAHPDKLAGADPGYGDAQRPEDYLKAFAAFINSHSNDMPALMTVLTRPRELTRKQLRELALALDLAGYNETAIASAWRQTTNQEIAARIVGFIRQAAIGDPLIPYVERVDHALQKLLGSRAWTGPQRDWLKKIAAQTKANTLVDREAIDDPDLLFRTQGGGFERINRTFDGQLQQTLDAFNDAIWAA